MAYAPGSPKRALFDYIDDDAGAHRITQKKIVGDAVGNTESTGSAPIGRPSFWRLRHVHLNYNDGAGTTANKRVVIGSSSNGIFLGTTATVAALEGVTWNVEGKIGERRP